MSFDWGTQLLRLSVFSTGTIAAEEKNWQAVTGQEEAENRVTTPGGKAFMGRYAGGQLALSFSGPRFDLILAATDTENVEGSEEPKLPTIGNWKDLLGVFTEAAEKCLTYANIPIFRMAFGAVLLLQTGSREETYEQLAKLLRSTKVSKEMRDLLYRCNWPQQSTVKDKLTLNRLTTWSSIRGMQKFLQVTGEQTSVMDGPQWNAVKLEIDNNTEETRTDPFEPSEIVPIFKELVTLAVENTETGEVQ